VDAYSQIGEHMPLLEQYKALFGANPHMGRVLALMYADILRFHKGAMRFFTGRGNCLLGPHIFTYISDDSIATVWRQIFRSIWNDFKTRFKQILDSLSQHRQLIVEQAALLHFQQYQVDGQATLRHIQRYEQDRSEKFVLLKKQEADEMHKKYLAVLEWFSAAQSTVLDHHNFRDIRNKYAGSGDWILKNEKVQDWMEHDTPVSSVLWLNGIPGAGMPKFLTCFVGNPTC
jgi:hypothetical protein